ncbi:MAG: FGGY family carbohydrate kinase [Armatimonadetes bacterium]|nr:FGGY family carbohydrate kinase [Armatimonadota bacterium]MCX7969096.1 FGGY family carbohydrate kinase [Armatimonadota bacterium]MDW8144099.1 FGGY-family carbohydrate kinase [Armatimonadota bacterium]
MSLMGVDTGTTGVKAVIFNCDGEILGQGYREYPLIYPGPNGWVELDAEQIWEATKEAIAEAIAKAGKGDPVEAIAVSSMSETVVPIGRDGRSLANAIANLDTRPVVQAKQLEETLGQWRVFSLTGHPIHPMYTVPKLMWFKQERPEIFGKVWKFLCIQDFVSFRLGAKDPAIDWSMASRTMGFNVLQKKWCREVLDAAGLSEEMLPRPLPAGEPIGTVDTKVAEETGLSPKVVIATGGHDQPCGCLGSGVVKGGVAMDAIGTVDCITVAMSEPVLNETMLKNNFCCYPHVAEDLYVTVTWSWTGGILLRWYRDTFASEEKSVAERMGVDVYDLIVAQASKKPTNLFVLPHFTPTTGTPWMDTQSKGVVAGLTINTTRGEFVRALLEGVNYEMRLNLELLKEAGISVREVRAIGGGAKSQFWLQLKANIFNVPVISLHVSEAACFGAAIAAGKAIGKWKRMVDAAENLVRVKEVFEPQPDEVSLYEERFALYRDLYPLIRNWLHRIYLLSSA